MNDQAPWRRHENYEIEAAVQDRISRAIFTNAEDVRYGFFEGYDFACRAAGKPVPPTVDVLARAYDPDAFEDHPIEQRFNVAAIQWAARRHLATEAAQRLLASGLWGAL